MVTCCISFFLSLVSFPLHLQKRLAQCASHQGGTSADGVSSRLGSQLRVNLDEIDGNEAAGLVDGLADVVTLTEGQAAAHGGAGAGSPHGVEGVDVEGQVDGGVGANVGEGHFHDAADTVAIVNLS